MSNELPNNDQSAQKQGDVEMSSTTEPNPDGFFADILNSQACSVRVALRVRPLSDKEIFEKSKVCITANNQENQMILGKDKVFTFDKTFDMFSTQESVFESCVKNLVLGCFAGFNATVLAYGQTGSGKTFTMGSGFTLGLKEQDLGIIPRVIRLIFQEEENRRNQAVFKIKCSFLEIYNEELIDLLDQGLIEKMIPQKKEITVREEKNGTISVHGLNEVTVKSATEMANFLDLGSNARKTAMTRMNENSSRSHGIFTVTIEQYPIDQTAVDEVSPDSQKPSTEFIVAKFHFVDLAGSERIKKTGATGSTLKEGININKSLLALGNVISALVDDTKKGGHVPYRDSKLTRILQDSLGGNSRTSMIACCSPAESNFDETLNTLKYADRARKIKNKPVINRDPASQQIAELKGQVLELQKELIGSRKLLVTNGIQFETKIELPNDLNFDQPILQKNSIDSNQESNRVLEAIIKDQKNSLQQKEQMIISLQAQCTNLKLFSDQLQISQLDNLKQRDEAKLFADQLCRKLSELGQPVINLESSGNNILDEYRQNCVMLEKQVNEMRQMLQILQIDNQSLIQQSQKDTETLESRQVEIEKLKLVNKRLQADLERVTKDLKQRQELQRGAPFPQNVQNERMLSIQGSTKLPSEEWISTDLEQKIKNFGQINEQIQERFIKNFGQQMTSMITGAGEQQFNRRHTVREPIQTENVDMESGFSESESDSQSEKDEVAAENGSNLPDDLTSIHLKEGVIIEGKEEIKTLEIQVKDAENLLDDFKKQQMDLQNNILAAMKEEYHKHIEQLNKDLQRLELDKSQQMSKAQGAQKSRIEDQFRKKQQDLELQIQQMGKKDRDTKLMQKQLEEQQKRVKTLENELVKLKTQRVITEKKVKDEQEQLAQYKKEQAKKIQNLKQQVLKSEKEKADLKRDANKKEIYAKRKAEELNALQQRQKLDQQKRQNAKTQRQQLKQVDLDQIKLWVIENTERMVEFHELKTDREMKDAEFEELESEIEQLQKQFAKLHVAEQRQVVRFDENVAAPLGQIETIREQIENLEEKQNFINAQIIELDKQIINLGPETLDAKVFEQVTSLEGARTCIEICFQQLFQSQIARNDLERENHFKQSEVDNCIAHIEQFKQLIEAKQNFHEEQMKELQVTLDNREKIWFRAIADRSGVDISSIQEGNLEQLFQICFNRKQDLQPSFSNDALKRGVNARIENQEAKKDIQNQTKAGLARIISDLEKKLQEKDSVNQKLVLEQQQAQRDKMKYKKQYEDEKARARKQAYLNDDILPQNLVKSNDSLSSGGVMLPITKSQTTVKQISYKDARNARKLKKAEDEQVVIPDLQLEENDDVNDVYHRLNQVKSRTYSSRQSSRPTSQLDFQFVNDSVIFPENHNWSIKIDKLDAHKSQVTALANIDQKLFSSANKSLKIWDIDTMQVISELTDNIGNVRSINICQERKILLAASDKSLIVWDLVGLTRIAEFKGLNDIKCLETLDGNLMFAGTKGGPTTGALYIFDIRKSYTQTIEEREKNQDIFCLKLTKDYLFMGCRNHNISPFDLKQWKTLPNLEPPHMDAVSCLTILGNNKLISGSKDKHLRAYDISNQYFANQGSVTNAHNDQINCLDNSKDNTQIFSGSRDGIVKVWNQQESSAQEMKCPAKLDGNATQSSVNAISTLNSRYGTAFATANADKSIRIWANTQGELSQRSHQSQINQDEPNTGAGGSALSQLLIHKQKKKQKANID